MVKDLKRVISAIEARFGPLALFCILKMDDIAEKWSLAVAANWIDELKSETKKDQIFDHIFDEIAVELTPNDAESIVRIGILHMNSHLAEGLIACTNKVEGDYIEIEDQQINGNTIHHGILFKTNTFIDSEFVSTD